MTNLCHLPVKKNVGLIFSEFMVNPLSGGAEYIELHNFRLQSYYKKVKCGKI